MMQKTKLGIPVGLMGALLFAAGYFSGYLLLFVMAGYVLLCEEDAWLRRTSVKAVLLTVVFSVISLVLGLVPDLIGILDDLLNVFGSYFSIPFITNVLNLLRSVIGLVETLVFAALGLMALGQSKMKIPVVDDYLEKNVD